VVDPLRWIAKKQPQLAAFRCYPPKFNPPANQAPDGSDLRAGRNWGVTPNRYYQMEMSFFMSGTGRRMVDIMSRNFLWISVLSSSAVMEPENRRGFPKLTQDMASKLQAAAESSGGFGGARPGGRGRSGKEPNKDLQSASKEACELAIEQASGHCGQVVKAGLFNWSTGSADEMKD